jgi:outer membrane immunogenic protein
MGIRGIAALALLLGGACAPGVALAGPGTIYNWSGGYVGALAGYGWGQNAMGESTFYEPSDTPKGTYPAFSFNGAGVTGGVGTGYLWQGSDLVYGFEADISAANIRGSFSDSDANFSVQSTINWYGTARLKVGVPVGNSLVYGTGGFAFGGVTTTLNDVYGSDTITSQVKTTNTGWTIGGGVATAVNSKWVLKAEYLYLDLGSKNHSISQDGGWPLITTNSKTTASVVRFGVDYKF